MYQTDVTVIPIFIERKCKSLYITECNYSSSRRNLRRISPVMGTSSADLRLWSLVSKSDSIADCSGHVLVAQVFHFSQSYSGVAWDFEGVYARREELRKVVVWTFKLTAVIILAWTREICLECLLWCNQSQTRSSHHRNHKQRTVSYLSRNKLFSFCFNIQSFYQ